MGSRFFALLLLFCLSFRVSNAGGEEEPEVGAPRADALSIRLRGCSHLSESRLGKILRLELSTLSAEERPGAIDVQVICFPDALVLSVTHGEGAAIDKRIDQVPVDVPERSVALAVSELISEAWRTEGKTAAPPPPPAKTEPDLPQKKRESRLEIPLVVLRHPRPRRLTFGGQVGFFREFSPRFEWGASLLADYGSHEGDVLRVKQLSLSMAPHLRARLFGPGAQLVLGVSSPFGWVHLKPETAVPGAAVESLSAPWAALRLESSLAVPLSERLFLSFGGTASAVWLPVRGTVVDPEEEVDQAAVEISGVVLGIFAGLGATF